jgi:hypothetical protein
MDARDAVRLTLAITSPQYSMPRRKLHASGWVNYVIGHLWISLFESTG